MYVENVGNPNKFQLLDATAMITFSFFAWASRESKFHSISTMNSPCQGRSERSTDNIHHSLTLSIAQLSPVHPASRIAHASTQAGRSSIWSSLLTIVS